ncbi:hypothetical protein N7I30_21255 [Aurantimonas litoralis]|nr:hypothetical protein [Aurantimonas litoralis]
MQFVARLLFVAFLSAFAASSVAHAAGSAKMAADMATSHVAAMEMADCDACDGPEVGDIGIACDVLCGSGSLAAILGPQSGRFIQPLGGLLDPAVTEDLCGLTCPPTEQPPRTFI